MYRYDTILAGLERNVLAAYPTQVLNSDRREDGAFVSDSARIPVANHGNHSRVLAMAGYAFLADGSSLRGDDELFDRLLRGIAFQKRWQREDGLIDNVSVNWDSPTATAFTVELLAPIVQLARDRFAEGDERAGKVADDLGEYILSGSEGALGKGFHTPNHRWVVCAGLAQAMTLFSEFDARSYVDDILAETIDINDDGEYIERSTGTYNAVCNRCLRIMADHLGRPNLLDPVRRNLDLMAHMFHPDWTIETAMSNRQDRGERKTPSVASSYFDLAQRDGNGTWAAIADRLTSPHSGDPWLLHPFIVNPAYREESLERVEPSDDYRRVYSTARIVRTRRGALSATSLADNDVPFTAVYGDVHLKSLRVGGSYHGATAFVADTFESTDTGVILVHLGENKQLPHYDLPVGRPVAYDEWRDLRPNREKWHQPTFDIHLSAEEVDSGFNLHLKTTGGIEGVTFWAEWCFATPGQWETDHQSMDAVNGQTVLLRDGYGIYHHGTSAVRLGPGKADHRMPILRQDDDTFRVLMALTSPIDHTFELRFGSWSTGTFEFLDG